MKPQNSTILVVDDEPMIRDILSEWIEFKGHRVLRAENGAEALRVVEANRVDLILSDIRMPVMDGVQMLKHLGTASNHIPSVIFVSGVTDIAPREAYDLGVEALLAKPFTDEQILGAIRRVLTSRAELWARPGPESTGAPLTANFSTVDSAASNGRLVFGRGGFCLHSAVTAAAQTLKRFVLNFEEQLLRLAGEGAVRWVEPAEQQIGVEIMALEPGSLAQGLSLTTAATRRCYIPRSSRSG